VTNDDTNALNSSPSFPCQRCSIWPGSPSWSDDGRIRLPDKLIPPLNSGGDHQHWWQLDKLAVSDAEIRASYRLNGLNKPKLRIDRSSGEISIKGTGQDFSGICQKIDAG